MAANRIEIIVGGQVDELVRAGNQGADALNKLGAAATKAGNDFSKGISEIGPAADKAAKQVGRLRDALRDPAGAAGKIADTVIPSLQELEAELNRLQQILRKSTDPEQMKRLGAEISRLQTGINNIKTVAFQNQMNKAGQSAAQAVNSLKKFTPGANEATFALVNLSRVAQDAPFGFIGIANNLNPLLESFQRLKQQTGTTQGAFKALLSSLGGAGGLGLAIGILTAGLTLLGQGFFSSGGSAKKAKEQVDEFKKTIEDAANAAARDATRVTTLFNALSSGTLNVEERKSALKELKEINKEFFGSLKDEEGLIKNLQTAYDGYLTRLKDIGRAKAIEAQLTRLFDRRLELELSIDPKFLTHTNPVIQESIGRLQKQLNALGGAVDLTKITDEQRKQVNFFDKSNSNLEKRIKLQQQIADLERGLSLLPSQEVRQTREQIKLLDLQISGLSKLQQATGEFDLRNQKSSEREEDALKKRLQALEKIKDATKDLSTVADLQQQIFDLQVKITLRDAAKNGLSKEEVDLAIQGFRDQLNEAFEREALSLEAIPEVKFSRVEIVPLDQGAIESAVAKAAGVDRKIPIESDREVLIRLKGLRFVLDQEELQKATERLRETILTGVQESIATTADVFGQVLSSALSGEGIGEGLAKAAQSLLSGIGTVVQEIGKQIIATSTAIKALKEALKTLIANPVGGIGIGISLVALGGFLKNIKIPAFADGVNNFSGGLALVGERGPELVRLPRGSDVIPNHMIGGAGAQQVTVNVVGRMSGKDVVFVGQRAIQSNKTTGGGGF